MTTLDFKDKLTENTFSYGNDFVYDENTKKSFSLYFSRDSINYPYILKGGQSNEEELEVSIYSYQLRSRVLNTKKIKEIMDSSRLPLLFNIKRRNYLLGKGFLAEYIHGEEINKILFVACVDGSKSVSSMEQVKFFVSKDIYTDEHKALQPAIKDFIGAHPGDVIICKNVLDYVGEKIVFPRGVLISELITYKDAIVRATVEREFDLEAPLVVDATFQDTTAPITIHAGSYIATDNSTVSPW